MTGLGTPVPSTWQPLCCLNASTSSAVLAATAGCSTLEQMRSTPNQQEQGAVCTMCRNVRGSCSLEVLLEGREVAEVLLPQLYAVEVSPRRAKAHPSIAVAHAAGEKSHCLPCMFLTLLQMPINCL